MPGRTPRFTTAAPAPTRKTANTKPYDAAWKKLRDAVLQAEPLCRICRANGLVTAADQVDHIMPKLLGGLDEWTNCQPLCGPCHREKTIDDMARIKRGW